MVKVKGEINSTVQYIVCNFKPVHQVDDWLAMKSITFDWGVKVPSKQYREYREH